MRKPDAYPEIVDAPDQRSSTFEAPGPDRARHRAHVGGEQWRRAWIRASRTPCGANLATAGGHGRRGPGAVAVPGADGSLAKRPATGTRLGLCGEGTAPPQRDTPAVVGRVSRRQSRRLWLYLVLHDLRGLEAACAPEHASDPHRWGEGVRRFRRRHHRHLNPITGEVRAMKLFVAAMGASNYTYAEACPSESLSDWIGMHTNLFKYLGGVPKFVVCDNLKAAVTNPDRYDP